MPARSRKLCVGAVRGGGYWTILCREYANVYPSILEKRSNPSSHSRARFPVTDQEAWVTAKRMRFRDEVFVPGKDGSLG